MKSKDSVEFIDMDVWDVFNFRVSRALFAADIKKISKLLVRSSTEIRGIPNIGKGSLKHIEDVLLEHGLYLPDRRYDKAQALDPLTKTNIIYVDKFVEREKIIEKKVYVEKEIIVEKEKIEYTVSYVETVLPALFKCIICDNYPNLTNEDCLYRVSCQQCGTNVYEQFTVRRPASLFPYVYAVLNKWNKLGRHLIKKSEVTSQPLLESTNEVKDKQF